jgi:1-acyl-sn-glycerol-3-phosphate acyltransferase
MNLDRLASSARLREPGRPTPAIAWVLRWIVRPWVRVMFRPTIVGLEHIPADRPFMIVGNHGAGFGAADIFSFAVLWLEHFGTSRRVAGFAHPFAFHVWPISWFMGGLGSIPSSYAAGLDALSNGIALVVFPGGDREASQSVVHGDKVDFAGRTGFIKLAREGNVPIVPMGSRGNHYPTPILFASRAVAWLAVLPRLFGLKRYPISVAAVAGALAIVLLCGALGAWRFLLAWAWFISPLALLPWVPWTIRIRVGAPIEQSELTGDASSARDCVESAVRTLAAR